jgi:LuxR family maltose regulon positive regulatory protein
MCSSLLTSKFNIPIYRRDLVPRPHLLEKLNAGLSRNLTLVSAPAGFGKTTLLSAWARQNSHNVAWLSLHEEDNDLSIFLSYFVAALRQLQPDFGTGILSVLNTPEVSESSL